METFKFHDVSTNGTTTNETTRTWLHAVNEAGRLMRTGEDYVNSNKRYDKAHVLLEKAYRIASKDPNASKLDLAKICLWDGISLNENLDIVPFTKRNDRAIKLYQKGIEHLRYVHLPKPMGTDVLSTRASLYNSLGVAHHHRTTRWTGGPIPTEAFNAYRKSRDIILAHPELRNKLATLAKKIKINSGGHIFVPTHLRGGAIDETDVIGGNHA